MNTSPARPRNLYLTLFVAALILIGATAYTVHRYDTQKAAAEALVRAQQ